MFYRHFATHLHAHMHLQRHSHMYICTYTYCCVCVCVCVLGIQSSVSFLLPLLSPQSQSSRMPINGWFRMKRGRGERIRKREEAEGKGKKRAAHTPLWRLNTALRHCEFNKDLREKSKIWQFDGYIITAARQRVQAGGCAGGKRGETGPMAGKTNK